MYSIDIIKSTINLYYKLHKEGIRGHKRINIIKNTFNVHINTVYNWINTYYKQFNYTFNFNTYKTKYKYNNTKITSSIEDYILNSIDKNNNFNIKKIKNNIRLKFNVLLSKSSIYHVLHKNKLTYKNNVIKNVPYDDITIKQCKIQLNNTISNIDKNKFLSYDEMSICLNSKPYKGWSKIGTVPIIKTKNKTIFNKRYTIGMSIDYNSNINFTFVNGALNGYKFNTFMNKICKNNNYVFMDNASIHKNRQFNKLIKNNKWNIIYNIPYHSHLNPIEYVFSLLRSQLLYNDNNTFNDIINTIINFKKNINKIHIKNIFNKCFKDISSVV